MSIVGYILGLGDRHPSNLMLHRFSVVSVPTKLILVLTKN